MPKQTANGRMRKPGRFYDYSLLFIIIFLSVFGLVMIYSSSSYNMQLKGNDPGKYMIKQGFALLLGFGAMFAISKWNYRSYARFTVPALVVSYVLMLLVNFTPLGIEANGKKRWLKFVGIQFQPSELVKITVILVLAVMITNMGKKVDEWKSWGKMIGLILPLVLLVMMNNLSTGIIICGIGFVMMFIACKKKWPFILCMILAVAAFLFAPYLAKTLMDMGVLQEYQLSRILVWKNPEAYSQQGGYQVLQGLYAIGSGGLWGKGLGQSIQKLSFLPEPQNDMIFAIICEELGLFGAIGLIILFLFMIYRFVFIANNAPDLFGAMLVVGVMAHIALQVILNIAVVTNVIPNTGITLPFISYGGTSVAILLAEMGLVLSVSNQIILER